MHVSVQFDSKDAVTVDERSRVWTDGPYTGTFFNTYFLQKSAVTLDDGSFDFTNAYMSGMKELLELESRVVEGKAYRISIVA